MRRTTHSMSTFFRKFLDLREGEMQRLLVMSGYIFVIIASYNVLKPMTRSLFVSQLGLNQLPFLYILLVITVAAFIAAYLKISAKLKLNHLINATMIFLMSNLLLFRWLLSFNITSPVFYYSLFIWASIYGVLTPTQFWLLANTLFNAREAKRLFPHLTTFAILGGITGGYATRFLLKPIGGTANLAFFCIALLAVALLLMNYAWHCKERSAPRTPIAAKPAGENPSSYRLMKEVFSIAKSSKHLASLMGIVAITFMVVQIADFQFVAYGSQASAGTDDLTGFLGFWLSNMSIIAFLFQVLFSNSIIRHFGVGSTIVFLPVALFLSSFWVLMQFGLASVLALKIGDGAFRHSINKVGIELLYLPIPSDIKKKTKAFIDMFVDRFGRGMAGVILLIFYSWLGFSIAQISLISMTAVLIWLGLSVVMYREYVNSFRKALSRRTIDTDLISVSIKDEKTINTLKQLLSSPNERQVVYALQLLESVAGVNIVPNLKPLLQHRSAEIRYHTLQLIRLQHLDALQEDVQPLLQDKDEKVQREAVYIYSSFHPKQCMDMLKEWLRDDKHGLQGATLYYLAQHPQLADQLLDLELIESFVHGDALHRKRVAETLGILNNVKYYPYLRQLLRDKNASVKLKAIKSAGMTCAPDFIRPLLQLLGDKHFKKAAREAMAIYGETILGKLAQTFNDASISMNICLGIPRVFGLIPSQESVNFLLDNLNQKNEKLRYQIIKALNKIRKTSPDLNFDHRVDDALIEELKNYYNILLILHRTNHKDDKRKYVNLLQRTLQERLDDHLERMFRLLGLRYPPRDIYNAFAAANSQNKSIQANAIEFLDNILAARYKRYILSAVEDMPTDQVLRQLNGLIEINIHNRKDALMFLLNNNPDPWLCAVSLFEIGQLGLGAEFKSQLKKASRHENSLIQETAKLVIHKFN